MASKSKRNRVKFKFTKELAFLIAFIVVILGLTIGLSIPSKSTKQLEAINDAIIKYDNENSASYNKLDKDHHFSVISGGMKKKVNKVRDLADRDKYTYVFYGTLNNSTFLEQLYYIDYQCDKERYNISKVYLFYADYVEEAKENGDDDTKAFKDTISKYEDKLNKKVSDDSVDFDMTTIPTLLVFHKGELIFNTQQDKDEKSNWTTYITKAFSFQKYEDKE